jgi:hypothetical protein
MIEGEKQPVKYQVFCEHGRCKRWAPIKAVLNDGAKMEVCGEHFLQLIDDGTLDHTEFPNFPREYFTKEFYEQYQRSVEKWLEEPDENK